MNEIIKICPYLGMADDPATNTSFPSGWNHCHHVKPVEVVVFNHQHDYCLSKKHIKCPVFLREKETALPTQLRAPRNRVGRRRSLNWKIILMVLFIIAVLVFAGFSLFSSKPMIPMTGMGRTMTMEMELTQVTQTAVITVTQTSTIRPTITDSDSINSATLTQMALIASEITASPSLTLTNTLNPTRTFTPTLTPTLTATSTATSEPPLYGLDTLIGTDYQFVIHKVQSGESLNLYAAIYNTTEEAIFRVNYGLISPLWVDIIVVIPVEFTEVTQMPYFQPYTVTTDGITVEALVLELATNLDDFIYYNGLSRGERLSFGDWILVPRYQSAN